MLLTSRAVTLRLAETFTISRSSEDEAEVVQVEVKQGDATGYGEGAPIERYEESAASAGAWLEQVALGADPFALDEIWERLRAFVPHVWPVRVGGSRHFGGAERPFRAAALWTGALSAVLGACERLA